MTDEQRTKVIDAALTLSKLRELQGANVGGPYPSWLVVNGWASALSELAGAAAYLIASADRPSLCAVYKAELQRLLKDMAIICKVLVEARKELEGYTHGVTDDSYDSSMLDAVIILLDSHLF